MKILASAVAATILFSGVQFGARATSVRAVKEKEEQVGPVPLGIRKLDGDDRIEGDHYKRAYETGSCTCAKDAYMAVYEAAERELKMIPLLEKVYSSLERYVNKLADYAVCSLHSVDCGCEEGYNYFSYYKVSTYQCCCDVDAIKDIIVSSIKEIAGSWTMNHDSTPSVDAVSVMKRKLFNVYGNSLERTAGAATKIGNGMYFDSETCEREAFCGNNGHALEPTHANILHCIDKNRNGESVWETYFNDKSYTNYNKIGGSASNRRQARRRRRDCRNALVDGTDWDAVIIEEQKFGYGMTIMPESILWARNNPDRPLIYHDTANAFFHWGNDAVVRKAPRDIRNYDVVYPSHGGAFDGFAPLVVTGSNGRKSTTVEGGAGGVVQATHNKRTGGTAMVRNGNVWGMGPNGDSLNTNPNSVVFPYLEAILCCKDCCRYTPLPDCDSTSGEVCYDKGPVQGQPEPSSQANVDDIDDMDIVEPCDAEDDEEQCDVEDEGGEE